MIEFAGKNDRDALKNMWQSIFLEDKEVTDLFFRNVCNIITPVIRENGEIMSSLFLLDCKIGAFNGKCVYCAMTKYSARGKGYMKKLLDFSYTYCKNNEFDFLFLVPAEKSLFDYYEKCGFEPYGISRRHIFDGTTPEKKEMLKTDCEIVFDDEILEHWENSCRIYGGEVTKIGLCFEDDNMIIRNSRCDFDEIPEKYRNAGNIIQGKLTFGEDYTPAMIKTDNENIKKLSCYIGITLE